MPGTFSDSWKLTRTSFRLIFEDRALLVFPLVAGLSILGVLALLLFGEFLLFRPGLAFGAPGPSNAVRALGVVLFLVAYFAMAFLSVYCTAALVGAATLKLAGAQPTAADGWKVARVKLRRLIVWALITATVGLVIQAISSRLRGVGGAIIGAVGGVAWGVVTYFMIPVLLYENERPWPALKRSAHLFTSTFGRSLVTNLVLGLILGVGIVAGVILGVLGFVYLVGGALVLGLTLLGAGIAVAVLVALVGSAAEGVLRAALYRYATTGKIDPDLLPAAYRTSGGPPSSAPLA
jgi:hypothetical protein